MTQGQALDILKTGANAFLTGAAGAGKTHVLREYIKYLGNIQAVAGITASTGIAATHMGGTTIHSWSGIGIADSLSKSEVEAIAMKSHVSGKIKKADILVIDEISMLHHYRLDLIDAIVRVVKKVNEPFGGMQTILCGDFFQLPPISRYGEPPSEFAYSSRVWQELNPKILYLDEQHRQNDAVFLRVLNAIRENTIDEDIVALLKGRMVRESEVSGEAVSTRLYPLNRDVESENNARLATLESRAFTYAMTSKGNKTLVETLKKGCLAPEILKIKKDAKVIFVRNNLNEGYVNGTQGTVDFCSEREIRILTSEGRQIELEPESWTIEEDGRIKAEISQYPIRLAWAITIHKSQGMSLDNALMNLSGAFEPGMGYVALSRVRSLSGLYLTGLNRTALQINQQVLAVDQKFRELSTAHAFDITSILEREKASLHKLFANRVGKKSGVVKMDSVSITKEFLEKGTALKDIAKERELKLETILDHIEEIRLDNPSFNIFYLQSDIPKKKFSDIYSAFKKLGMIDGQYRLRPVKDVLGDKYTYPELRLVRLFL